MKKIIDGKIYNTETANEIEEWNNGFGGGDFRYCYETLYQSKKGVFFLYGRGGALSKYAETYGNMKTENSEIIVMTEKEAFCWLSNVNPDKAIELFPHMIEEA